MKYLCLICAEKMIEAMSKFAAAKHLEEYREFTEEIRHSEIETTIHLPKGTHPAVSGSGIGSRILNDVVDRNFPG